MPFGARDLQHAPRVVLAPDKFKGSLSAAEVCAALSAGIQEIAPDADLTSVPVADGGDGTLDAALAAGFRSVPVTVDGPTGPAVEAAYGRRGDRAVVELAALNGLARLPGGRLDPLGASTLGVGQAIAAALDAGCRRIVLGIGGSASTDGGAGLLVGLGARLLGADGSPVRPSGGGLSQVMTLDLDGLHPAIRSAELVVAGDVDNPLLGVDGAAAVYAPQKGATPAQVADLKRSLAQWADVVERATGVDRRADPGAGAAGGVGFAAIAVLGAKMVRGAELILELVGFPAALGGADLVVTGEGALDEQTLRGKAPAAVAAAARAAGVTTVAVAGRVDLSAAKLVAAGVSRAYSLAELEPNPARSIENAPSLIRAVGRRLAQDWLR